MNRFSRLSYQLIALITLVMPIYGYSESLPASITKTLKRANIPEEAVSWSIAKIQPIKSGAGFEMREISEFNAEQGMNPASTMKLVTSLAAIETLGPAYRWKTSIYTNGEIKSGTLTGDLLIKGTGDPKLIPEELAKVFQNLQQLGIKKIDGDLIFDRSLYDTSVRESSFSDGEPNRAYNANPDALLYAFNSISFQLLLSPASEFVLINQTPKLANLKIDNNLRIVDEPCEDWKRNISFRFEVQKNNQWLAIFDGDYPQGCKSATWNILAPDASVFLQNSIISLWEEAGGIWRKRPNVKPSVNSQSFRLLTSHEGIPLADSIKDINKLSNNVMARQVLLTLSLEKTAIGNTKNGARIIRDWLQKNNLDMPELVIENGSGLSRVERISTGHLNKILLLGINSPYRNHFVESLPIAGVDGTMKHRLVEKLRKYFPNKKQSEALKKNLEPFPPSLKNYGALIKTGSLMDVRSISGYVISRSGEVYAVTSFINHPNAGLGKNFHDMMLSWLLDDGPMN